MKSLSFDKSFNNSKLFFSKNELSKILSCYSLGVSRGNWKDYAINFSKNEASFLMFKNTVGFPDCVLTKSLRNKTTAVFQYCKSSSTDQSYTEQTYLHCPVFRFCSISSFNNSKLFGSCFGTFASRFLYEFPTLANRSVTPETEFERNLRLSV